MTDLSSFSNAELQQMRNEHLDMANKIEAILKSSFVANPRADQIIAGICDYFHITYDQLKIRSRNSGIVAKRQITAHVLRNYTMASHYRIATLLGYRNHATVIHHVRAMDNSLSEKAFGDAKVRQQYQNILDYLCLTKKLTNYETKKSA